VFWSRFLRNGAGFFGGKVVFDDKYQGIVISF
jgi:hypothetical protein